MATELEIMSHAKNYLDKLANGINPLTGETLPDADIVNQVRISRCLFYVSDVLRQVIERGGLQKSQKGGKLPFRMTEEQKKAFEYFDDPIHVSAITERINSLIEDPNMKKLSYISITTFLESQGYMKTIAKPNKGTRREPTEAGLALGISIEERIGYNGRYSVVFYDRKVQQYILDNMDQIETFNQMTKKERFNISPPQTESVDPETGEIIRDNT